MYVNDLGMRNVDRVNSYRDSARSRSSAGGIVDAGSFARQLQKALAGGDATAESGEAAGANSKKSCCEQCDLNSRLITQMMTRSLYTQSGLGLLGYSSAGAGSLAAYQSMMGLFSGLAL